VKVGKLELWLTEQRQQQKQALEGLFLLLAYRFLLGGWRWQGWKCGRWGRLCRVGWL